jgi:hypothetical protein
LIKDRTIEDDPERENEEDDDVEKGFNRISDVED